MSARIRNRSGDFDRILLGTFVVGAGYAVTLLASDIVETAVTGEIDGADIFESLPILVASGILLGATLSPIAARMHGSRRRQFLVWWVLVYLSTLGVLVEGRAFAPDLVPLTGIPWSLFSYVVVAAVVAGALAFIFAPASERGSTVPDLPDRRQLLIGIIAGTLTYAVLYFVVGALNYAFVTGPYYEENISGLVNPPIQVVVTVFLFRGALMSVSLVPLVRTFDSPSRRAWTSGLSIAVLAGFLPLLRQVGQLPTVVLATSSVEIVLQVCPAAIVVAAVLGKDARQSVRSELARMYHNTTTDRDG